VRSRSDRIAMASVARIGSEQTVRRVLSRRGPMRDDDLLEVPRADGVDLGLDPEETLAEALDEDAELILPLADGRWAWIPALLAGRIFTHRLSAVEAEHDLRVRTSSGATDDVERERDLPEVGNEGSEFGGTFERGQGA
jgi:hypothetical protein